MALTALGTRIVKKLQECLQRNEPEFTDVDAKELALYINESVETVRGALPNLYAEGYAVSYEPGGVGILIGLTEKGWAVE